MNEQVKTQDAQSYPCTSRPIYFVAISFQNNKCAVCTLITLSTPKIYTKWSSPGFRAFPIAPAFKLESSRPQQQILPRHETLLGCLFRHPGRRSLHVLSHYFHTFQAIIILQHVLSTNGGFLSTTTSPCKNRNTKAKNQINMLT